MAFQVRSKTLSHMRPDQKPVKTIVEIQEHHDSLEVPCDHKAAGPLPRFGEFNHLREALRVEW